MAEKRRTMRIDGPSLTRVRYGRATLTIARSGGLVMGDLGSAIDAYERDEVSAEELGERFARARVRAHSPSFSWEEADRQRVLDLVVEASEDPRFESTEPGQVAHRLVAATDAAVVDAIDIGCSTERPADAPDGGRSELR